MTSNKRERELARAKAARQQQRREHARARARRNRLIGGGVTAAIAAVAIAWAAWPSSDSAPAGAVDEASPAVSAEPSEANTPGPVATPAGVSCREPGAAREDGRTWQKPEDLGLTGTATWALSTNCGTITVALDADKAPENVNALAFLTEQGYYTGNYCHRLTTAGIFVLQCGAPGSDGTGDVGFTLPDENTPKAGEGNYPAGAVAMANRGPDTASSQIFIVYEDSTLPPNYTIVGQVTEGLDVVKYVAAGGVEAGSADSTDGAPQQKIVITKAKVKDAA